MNAIRREEREREREIGERNEPEEKGGESNVDSKCSFFVWFSSSVLFCTFCSCF